MLYLVHAKEWPIAYIQTSGGLLCGVSPVFYGLWIPRDPVRTVHGLTPGRLDDVIKWKHFPRYWPYVQGTHRPPVNSPDKGQWRRALMFSFICDWINGWVNTREAGDLRSHWAHYDVTDIMYTTPWAYCSDRGWLNKIAMNINNYNHVKRSDIITHSYHNVKESSTTKSSFNSIVNWIVIDKQLHLI